MDRLRRLFRRGVEDEREEPELQRVERLVQWFRWLGVASWIWLIRGASSQADPTVVYGVYAATIVYAGICDVVVRRAARIAPISVLTTLGDTVVIAAMCFISGGVESPIFPVFFLSVLATTLRFGMAEALVIASLDTFHATLLYWIVGGARLFDLAEGVFYLYFVALLGGVLSREARRQHARAVKERERASLLLSLNRQIVGSSDLTELSSRILEMMLRVVPARGACVILRRPNEERADRAIASGRLDPPSADESDALLRCNAILEAEEVGRLVLTDPAEITRRMPGAWVAGQTASHVAIAAIRGARPLGVLILFGDEGRAPPSDEELLLLGVVAAETAVAIQKARLGTDLVEAQARGRQLLRRMIDAEEGERRRIAGELHDRMGKRFFEFYYDVRLLQGMSVDRDSASSEILARIIESARECAGEIRTLMNDLRPSVLDDFGFLEALKEFATGMAARGELELTLAIDEAAPSGGPEIDLMLFRVLQEAVFNARKHASAKHVEVEFGPTDDRKLRLVVRDDGCGFDLDSRSPGHYGLLYMKERAEACGAEFAVRSIPRQGTEIDVTVPIPR